VLRGNKNISTRNVLEKTIEITIASARIYGKPTLSSSNYMKTYPPISFKTSSRDIINFQFIVAQHSFTFFASFLDLRENDSRI